MTEAYIASMKSGLQPMMNVAEINRQTFEKLTSMQTEFLSNCFKANLEQFKVLTEIQDPQAAATLQIEFCKSMGDKLSDATEQEIAVYSEAQIAFMDIVKEGCAQISDMALFKDVGTTFFAPPAAEKATPKKAPATK